MNFNDEKIEQTKIKCSSNSVKITKAIFINLDYTIF